MGTVLGHLKTLAIWGVGTWVFWQVVIFALGLAGYDLRQVFAWMWGV